jgi:trans-aconitate methyltransferase
MNNKSSQPISSSPSGVGGFEWNADLYSSKHNFVFKYGEDLIGWLQPKAGERILDVGCGTGELTYELSKSGATIIGIDASEQMINKAKQQFSNIQFFVKNATNFSFNKLFDAAFSNATLHWINNQLEALQCIYNSLKEGGRFVFEMGGKHNIESIHSAVKKAMAEAGLEDKIPTVSNYFPSVAEQTKLLEQAGFTISDVAYFKRPTVLQGEDGMRNWIVQFCTFFFTQIPAADTEEIINNAVEILRPNNFKSGTWYADYVRLRVKAVKE